MSDTKAVPTVEQLHETIKRIVEAKGRDYVYQQPEVGRDDYDEPYTDCLYVDDNGPSCLAGQVMHELGVSLDQLRKYEGTSADVAWTIEMEGEDYRSLERPGPLARALREAQRAQDTGETWGVALDRFEAVLGLSDTE